MPNLGDLYVAKTSFVNEAGHNVSQGTVCFFTETPDLEFWFRLVLTSGVYGMLAEVKDLPKEEG